MSICHILCQICQYVDTCQHVTSIHVILRQQIVSTYCVNILCQYASMLTQYVNMSHQVMSSCVSILCQHIVSICQYVDNIKSCHIVSTYCVKYVNTLTHHVNMSHQVMSCCVNIWCQYIVSICQHVDMMIIAFITFNYSSVPLIEGLCSSNP